MNKPSVLQEQLLFQAYSHPKFAALVFDCTTLCPGCECELVFSIGEWGSRRAFICQHCGIIFREKRQLAA